MSSQNIDQADADILKKKQLCLMEDSEMETTHPDGNNNNGEKDENQCREDFFDTGFQQNSKVSRRIRQTPVPKSVEDNEPLIIYSEENSSITRTARDQFAVTLLKLQTDLEATGRRLGELETAVRNAGSNGSRGTTKCEKGNRPASAGSKWQSGGPIQILYLGWPIFVYIAMRYMERRSLNNKLLN